METLASHYKDGLTSAELDALAEIMDPEIREQIHQDLAPCNPDEFLAEYIRRDPAFGEITAW